MKNRKPTAQDIKETKEVLSGFLIEEDVPNFDTLCQLERWQRNLIENRLNTWQSFLPVCTGVAR